MELENFAFQNEEEIDLYMEYLKTLEQLSEFNLTESHHAPRDPSDVGQGASNEGQGDLSSLAEKWGINTPHGTSVAGDPTPVWVAESMPYAHDNADTQAELVPSAELVNTIENHMALAKEDKALAAHVGGSTDHDADNMTNNGEGSTAPHTQNSEAPCFPEVPDTALTRRNQFRMKRTIKEEKEQKKAQKGKGKGKGKGGKGRGKGKRGSKGKGKSSKKHAKTNKKANKLRNSKRRSARKAKARRAALANRNRSLSDSSSETQGPCDAEEHTLQETHASYREQAQQPEQTHDQSHSNSTGKPTKKSSNSKGKNRKTTETSKKKSKVSKVSKVSRSTRQKSGGTDEVHPQAARPKAKAKAKAKTQAKSRARKARVPTAPAQDPADVSLGPEPAEVAEPVVAAEPVAQPAMAGNVVGVDQDEVGSVVAEAGDNVTGPLVDEFRAKAKSMYTKCHVPGHPGCVSDHLGEEMPQADGFQFSVYWSRKAVGVKILESLLRNSLRKGKNAYQQIAYFSGGTCSHVNIEAARVYVQELSQQMNAPNGPDPSSASMRAFADSLKSARAQAFREVTDQQTE
ncbi:unnamed protein product [Cladocopium goreaui]|uniref:Uncharacterized protein n=1 Tax=Cladocopium goreaui TaxID=2562237 RepID=A0A9P1D738_9DINO|nr:unnamed protein product [Cladocopium goreaui]